jgi:hypothetical protein
MNKEKPSLFASLSAVLMTGVILSVVGFFTIPIIIGVVLMPLGFILAAVGFIGLCVQIVVKITKTIRRKT